MAARKEKLTTAVDLSEVQTFIKSLVGKPIVISYQNRGKNVQERGIITAAFNNIFVFEYHKLDSDLKESFTYSDVITNGITIVEDN